MSFSPKMIRNQKERSRQLGWKLEPFFLPDPPKSENKSVSQVLLQAVKEKVLKSSNLGVNITPQSTGNIVYFMQLLLRLILYCVCAYLRVYVIRYMVPRFFDVLNRVFI